MLLKITNLKLMVSLKKLSKQNLSATKKMRYVSSKICKWQIKNFPVQQWVNRSVRVIRCNSSTLKCLHVIHRLPQILNDQTMKLKNPKGGTSLCLLIYDRITMLDMRQLNHRQREESPKYKSLITNLLSKHCKISRHL